MIGWMQVRTDTATGEVTAKGKVHTLQAQITFRLEPHPERGTRERAPDFRAVVKTGDSLIPVGHAWTNEVKRGDNAGEKMFNVCLTDPAFPEWCKNISAFPTGRTDADGYKLYELTESRGRDTRDVNIGS